MCRPFRPTLRENRLSSDAPSGPLPAEPHERCRPFTIQSAFRRRAAPTNREPCADFCNQREDRAHPRTARIPARRRRAPAPAIEGRGRRSTGYPAGSRAPAPPVAPTRPSFGSKAREACSSRSGHPCRAARRLKTRSGFSAPRAPRPAPRPAARTVRSSDEPECLLAGRNLDSSPGLAADSSGGSGDVHFSRERRRALDGAQSSARGREAAR